MDQKDKSQKETNKNQTRLAKCRAVKSRIENNAPLNYITCSNVLANAFTDIILCDVTSSRNCKPCYNKFATDILNTIKNINNKYTLNNTPTVMASKQEYNILVTYL